jgi:hypothetical protein
MDDLDKPTAAHTGQESAPLDCEPAVPAQEPTGAPEPTAAPADPIAAPANNERPAAPADDERTTAAADNGSPAAALAASAPEHSALFGPPELIAGENPRDYENLLARIYEALKPEDFIEEIMIRDIMDLSWELLRLRRVSAKLFDAVRNVPAYEYKGLSIRIDHFERIDQIVTTIQARRNTALHEIERHRATLGQRLRQARVEDVEFKVVESNPHDDESAT